MVVISGAVRVRVDIKARIVRVQKLVQEQAGIQDCKYTTMHEKQAREYSFLNQCHANYIQPFTCTKRAFDGTWRTANAS